MINLLENIYTEIVEMKKILHLIWVGIGLIFALLIVIYRQQMDLFFNSQSASNYLLIAIIMVDGMGNFLTYYIGNRDKIDVERKTHTKQLIDNIFSKMADLRITLGGDHEINFSIPKPREVLEKEDQYDPDFSEWWDITDLPKTYLDYAIKHLEKYEKITSNWNKLFELSKQHNDSLDKNKEKVKSMIKTIFVNHFTYIKELNENNENGYNLQGITDALSSYLYVNSLDLQSEEYDDKEIKISLSEEENYNGSYRIARSGYAETLIQCTTKNEVDINLLSNLLTEIFTDENIKKQFKKTISIRKECDETFELFRNEMALLIEQLESGIKLKGKCILGY